MSKFILKPAGVLPEALIGSTQPVESDKALIFLATVDGDVMVREALDIINIDDEKEV